ncbi:MULTISPECIES: hypothetical protein [unclassified Bradyrhizobium]|uniref:hypothetical protein n=1 Tax=unclassified Bradyrhizobium TaxID=2631580 RepID=UPI0028E592EF|nr:MULTISPECIES: hypothetical protein [unclassified Bradyrhizobium]
MPKWRRSTVKAVAPLGSRARLLLGGNIDVENAELILGVVDLTPAPSSSIHARDGASDAAIEDRGSRWFRPAGSASY